MSTHCRIGLLRKNGTVRSIYKQFDGYFSEMKPMLLQNYNNIAIINEMLDLGDCSSLGATLKSSEFYHRDRKEDFDTVAPCESSSIKEFMHIGEEYMYFFSEEDNIWICYTGKNPPMPLTTADEND